MDLKMIRTTGEPMSITSPAMPQALGVEAPGVLTAASESVFDPQALAAQVVAFQAGGQMTPEQQTLAAQSLGEELRAMTPEQRRQVSEVLRQRTPMTPIPSGGVNLPASNAASPASPSRSRAHISGSGTLPLSASHANVPASTDR